MESDRSNLEQPIGIPLPAWLPCPVPPPAEMTGQYCVLAPVDLGLHAKELFQAFAQDKISRNWTYLPYGPFASFESFREWMHTTCTGSDPLFHTIVDLSSERPVGLASYLRIEPESGVIEVGHIHYSPLLQKTRPATEAMYLMMKRVFDGLGYRRYEWKCDALNGPSRRAAERLGFQFEGIFRQATVYKGRNRDTAWYSIIDREWPALRTALEQWLSPENFDNHGRQIRRLETFR